MSADLRHRGHLRYAFWHLLKAAWWALNPLLFRQRATGTETLPRDGPYLVLPNHTSMLDPFWTAYHLGRPVWFMASAQLFRLRLVGPLVSSLGAFPKVKFVKDHQAMGRVQELYDKGQIVMIFPEGERSWDGVPTPILPGIGRLVKRLEARVVFARILTGHFFHPRWADYPRWMPIQIDFSEPVTFPPDATPEAITAEVERQLAIDPDIVVDAPTFGRRLAWGLPGYLWACPACLVPNALVVDPQDGNRVACQGCRAAWTVTTTQRLVPATAGAPALTVPAAYAEIRRHFGDPPVADRERHARDGVVLECARARVGLVQPAGPPSPLVEGRLSLLAHGLRVSDGARNLWTLRFTDVVSVSAEFQNRLHLRTAEAIYQLDPEGQGICQWTEFLRPWWALATRGDPAAWRPT